MTLSLTLPHSNSLVCQSNVPDTLLLGALIAFFLGLCFALTGAALSIYAWCVNDSALQRLATWVMSALLPCLFLAAYCLDRYESRKGRRRE